MNKNIEVINENLWAVNFELVKSGFIKEIRLVDAANAQFACLTNKGRILLDKGHPIYQRHLPLVLEVMNLTDSQMDEPESFYMVMKNLVKTFQSCTNERIEQLIQQYDLENVRNIFIMCCDLEKQRRQHKKQYSSLLGKVKHFIRKVGEKNARDKNPN